MHPTLLARSAAHSEDQQIWKPSLSVFPWDWRSQTSVSTNCGN